MNYDPNDFEVLSSPSTKDSEEFTIVAPPQGKSEKMRREEKRQFNQQLNDVGETPIEQPVASFAQGALNTIFAGAPEATAKYLGGESSKQALEGMQSPQMQAPYSYAIGQTAGAFLPLGRATKLAKLGWKTAAAEGARLGALYGATGNIASSLEKKPTLGQSIISGVQGAALGAPLGALAGGVMGKLATPRNITKLTQEAESDVTRALSKGIESQAKKASAPQIEIPNPEGISLSRSEAAIQRAVPLIQNENPAPKDTTDVRMATYSAKDKLMKFVDRRLTAEQNKGTSIPGDELSLESLKTVFPEGFEKRMSSVEKQGLDESLNTILKFRGKQYSGQGLDRLAEMVLSNKGPFKSLPQENRVGLVNYINSIDRAGEGISGDKLFTLGIKQLYPVDIAIPDSRIIDIANSSTRFSGKNLRPWELEDRIRDINDKLATIYEKKNSQQAVAFSDDEIKSLEQEASLLRNYRNAAVSRYPNEFKNAKFDIGALIEFEDMARTAGAKEKEMVDRGLIDKAIHRGGIEKNSLASLLRLFVPSESEKTPSQLFKRGFGRYEKAQHIKKPRLTEVFSSSPATKVGAGAIGKESQEQE